MPHLTTYRKSARGVLIPVKSYVAFAEPDEHPAGQRLRQSPDTYGAFANLYQRELVTEYDRWSAVTQRAIISASRDGLPLAQITGIIDQRLADLESKLQVLGRAKIAEASGLGLGEVLGRRATEPRVLAKIAQLQTQNAQFISSSLIPQLRQKFLNSIDDVLRAENVGLIRSSLKGLFDSQRYRPAQYSGGAVLAIFDVQKEAGSVENAERRAAGEKLIPVRWVLAPAEHCQDDLSRGTFGCPGLASVYPEGWDSLPTVPAGNVSCLGNCKCHIEADFGSGWERVT